MSSEHEIVRQVCLAKDDPDAADQFLRDYMPFIRSETSRFLQRFPSAEYDDELSVAMMAFHEAITGYAKGRGAFLQYAAMLIRNRLIDYHRREKRHRGNLSMDVPAEEEDRTIGETLAGEGDHGEELILREATRARLKRSPETHRFWLFSFGHSRQLPAAETDHRRLPEGDGLR